MLRKSYYVDLVKDEILCVGSIPAETEGFFFKLDAILKRPFW